MYGHRKCVQSILKNPLGVQSINKCAGKNVLRTALMEVAYILFH